MIVNKPLFSVIIPTYNHGHFIGRCLDSLIRQTYSNWEAIIVNNFSEDNTIEVVESYRDQRIRLINNANHGIIAVSRNKGIELARGDWICFLDSDDWWTKDKLEACIPFLVDYDFVYTDMHICYQIHTKKSKVLRGYQVGNDPYQEMLLRGNPCINSSVVFRKSLIKKIGYLSEDIDLVAVEDFDYWLKIAREKVRFKHINRCLGHYWLGDSNISFNKRQITRMDTLYEKHLLNIKSTKLKQEIIAHLCYRQARIFQLLKEYSASAEKFRQAIHCQDFLILLRSCVFYSIVLLKHNYEKSRCLHFNSKL